MAISGLLAAIGIGAVGLGYARTHGGTPSSIPNARGVFSTLPGGSDPLTISQHQDPGTVAAGYVNTDGGAIAKVGTVTLGIGVPGSDVSTSAAEVTSVSAGIISPIATIAAGPSHINSGLTTDETTDSYHIAPTPGEAAAAAAAAKTIAATRAQLGRLGL